MKSSLSERFNRTLQEKINRYMIANDTRKFIDVVPSLVSGYNNTIHAVTKMRPAEIDMFNAPALASEENEMRLITKGKSVTLSKGYYRTVADVARDVQKALGGEFVYEQVPNEGFGKLVLKKDAQLFVALSIARALGMSEDEQKLTRHCPLLKLPWWKHSITD